MMSRCIIVISALVFATSCGQQEGAAPAPKTIAPEAYLDSETQSAFLYSISRYICKYPSQAGESNKWEERFDEAYAKLAGNQKLTFYHVDSTSGTHYFLVSRIAPSIHQKYVGLAGKFTPTAEDPLQSYEEVFRTWKMLPDEHKEKSEMLFRKFIDGEDLSPYYIQNSGGIEYIEFPDPETWYDKEARIWQSSRGDVLEPYRKERARADSLRNL